MKLKHSHQRQNKSIFQIRAAERELFVSSHNKILIIHNWSYHNQYQKTNLDQNITDISLSVN